MQGFKVCGVSEKGIKAMPMSMSKYAGSFVRLEDVQDGPREETIHKVTQGKFDKPNLLFESGRLLSLNTTNARTLYAAYGDNSQDWCDKRIKLFAGLLTNPEGKKQDGVLVEPISPKLSLAERTPLTEESAPSNEMDDEVPF
jgi:hypothetical protein